MLETILAIAGSSAVSTLMGYLVARRKNMAEAHRSEFELVQEAIRIWREQADELKGEVEALRKENKTLRCEIAKLRKTNEKFVRALENATPENLDAVVNELKKEVE